MNIQIICEQYNITNYTINSDGSIDVNDYVDLSEKGLTELPLSFNKVYGNFFCGDNKLTTLKGSPRWVDGSFFCSHNKLTSLEFSPDYIGVDFGCRENYLTDLVGSPKEVGGYFNCNDNYDLTNPKGVSEKIGDVFYCTNSKLEYIFNGVDRHFLYTFNFYKIIKDDTVNLKRLKYVMGLYDKRIDLNRIQKYYRLV